MASTQLFQVEGGYSDGNIHYLSDSGTPGGTTFTDNAPVGSMYTNTSTGVRHRKVESGSGSDKWRIEVKNEKVINEITQTGHGLSVGDLVYFDGSYKAAQADSTDTADVIGIVNEVRDTDTFDIVTSGYSDVSTSESDGAALFLSQDTAGAITTTKPETGIQKNIGVAIGGIVFIAIDITVDVSEADAPNVPLIVTETVTSQVVADDVPTSDVNGVVWMVTAASTSDSGKLVELISATHDGSNANHSQFSLVDAGDSINGLSYGVGINSGNMELTVVSTEEVNVAVRRIADA